MQTKLEHAVHLLIIIIHSRLIDYWLWKSGQSEAVTYWTTEQL